MPRHACRPLGISTYERVCYWCYNFVNLRNPLRNKCAYRRNTCRYLSTFSECFSCTCLCEKGFKNAICTCVVHSHHPIPACGLLKTKALRCCVMVQAGSRSTTVASGVQRPVAFCCGTPCPSLTASGTGVSLFGIRIATRGCSDDQLSLFFKNMELFVPYIFHLTLAPVTSHAALC